MRRAGVADGGGSMKSEDLISRQAAIDALENLRINSIDVEHGLTLLKGISAALDAIEQLPSVDAAPVKHGYWICHRDELDGDTAECSECHAEGMLYGDYCVNCGAIMDAVPPRLKNG